MADLEKIKKLRTLSGAGFKDCSLALQESNGELDKAN
jgi:Translation elongation factor Ts